MKLNLLVLVATVRVTSGVGGMAGCSSAESDSSGCERLADLTCDGTR
jgi:hypothetical protein